VCLSPRNLSLPAVVHSRTKTTGDIMASAPLDTLSSEDDDGPGTRIARLEATVEAIIRSLDSLQRSVEGLRSDMQSLELRVRQSLDASEQKFRHEIAALRHEISNLRQDLRQEIAQQFAQQRAEYKSQFDSTGVRFSALESRMDTLEARLDRLEARLDRLEAKVDRLEAKVDRLDEKLNNMAASLRAEMRWLMGLTAANTIAVLSLLFRHGGML
jgi:chromosome segregation ATPase